MENETTEGQVSPQERGAHDEVRERMLKMAAALRVEISVITSGGKPCLSIADRIVAGPWTGRGSTRDTFTVRLGDLLSAVAEDGHPRQSQEPLVEALLTAFADAADATGTQP